MARVRIEIVSMDVGNQINTGEVVQAEEIDLAAVGDTALSKAVPNGICGLHIAYIRIVSGTISWRKGDAAPSANAASGVLETRPGIERSDVHDAIPVKVFAGDQFGFINIAN